MDMKLLQCQHNLPWEGVPTGSTSNIGGDDLFC